MDPTFTYTSYLKTQQSFPSFLFPLSISNYSLLLFPYCPITYLSCLYLISAAGRQQAPTQYKIYNYNNMPPPPSSILIVGSGVFGLSTAYSLSTNPLYAHATLTLIDRSPFPAPDSSSIDSSRIIRSDYSDPAYAALAASAQHVWRDASPGGLGEGRYSESGLVLVADPARDAYVRDSLENVMSLQEDGAVRELKSRREIDDVVGTGGGSGEWGYVNWRSGWADAEAGMRWLRARVEGTGRVQFVCAEVSGLVQEGKRVVGVRLRNGSVKSAELVILAAGAWTGRLVDLRGRATATGQVLVYLDLTAEEQQELGKMPVLLNMSTGLFIIPPRNRVLKVARHAYGYSNPTKIQHPDGSGELIEVSLPRTAVDDPSQWVPREGEDACRDALREMIPALGNRPFTKSRICWYSDTPRGDFLITYHPELEGLFLATGGSGHGYKFLPVIGDEIVNCIGGQCPAEFKQKWEWPRNPVENVVTEDGSRGGRPGLTLREEQRKGSKL
jgi:sarcosine oxidase / L-pipecolate oxidase